MERELDILAPDWYAEAIGAPLAPIEGTLRGRFPGWLIRLSEWRPFVRGVLIFVAGRRSVRIALVKKAPGSGTVLILTALLQRERRLVLLEFLPREEPRSGLKRLLYRAWFERVETTAVRRAMRLGHVLTEREGQEYARLYGIPPARFRHLRWALCREPVEPPPFSAEAVGVISSGRVSCDWETLFAAAERGSWPLTVICGRRDLPRVEALNRGGRAEVLCEVSRDEHDRRLRAAAVYALPLLAAGPSAGHVRLMAAVGAGTPVVATCVSGLDGYVKEGETALLVPPGDSESLAAAIERLLEHPEERRNLRGAAYERAKGWTYHEYFAAVRELLLEGSA